ncbi:MAG: NAD(P)-binding domain-containing protein [Actinomycetota bacterium]|nr:NAD(P)-binding domain-containing protein [Actinomycetota bacterium]
MGESLAVQALEKGHDVVGYDPGGSEAVESGGGHVVSSVEELSTALNPARVALVYVPHGAPTEDVVGRLAGEFEAGDVLWTFLTKWPLPGAADVEETVSHGQVGEQLVDDLNTFSRSPYHETCAMASAGDAAARPGIDEVDPVALELVVTPARLLPVAVATIHD